jgi:ATP-dependent exoDNAse (exonuclease V) beta subunit
LYVAATRAQQRLIIPWFKEKGERLDLLRRGFEPEKSELMEVDCGGQCSPAVVAERTRGSASLRIEERKTWQRERQELLARASQPVARVSPSKLGGEPEPREEEPAGIARVVAMELGVAVHEALERGDATGLEGKAREMVERALASELMARVGKADEVYRELPFTMVTDAGLMEGKMDLLFREGNRWTLVDYKTDARPEPEKYRAQMAAYAEALERTAGVRVSETLLYFLGTGKIVSLS